MSNLDDLHRALGAFTQGMQGLAITQGINDATQQVNQINQQQMDLMQKRQAQTQVAQNLALRLTQAGADQGQIQAATSSVAPPPVRNSAEAYQQAVATGDKDMMSMAKNMQSFEQKPEMDKVAAQGQNEARVATIRGEYGLKEAGLKAGKAQTELQRQFGKAFDAQTKGLHEGLDSIDTMEQLSKLGNGVADMALRSNLARTIGSEKGRIAVQEISQYTGSQDLANQFMRAIGKAKSGEVLTAKDRKLVDQTIATAKAAKEAALKGYFQQHLGRGIEQGAFPDEETGAKFLAGHNPRLRAIAGYPMDDQSTSASGASGASGAVTQLTPAIVRDKSTGKIIRGVKDAQGNFHPNGDVAAELNAAGTATPVGAMINTGLKGK